MSAPNPTRPDPELLAGLTVRLRSAGCVFAEEEAALLLQAATDSKQLERLTIARISGRPLEQLLGWVDFGGLRLRVTDGVFVPRQRTLALAEHAVALTQAGDLLLDMCCGVGAVAAFVASRVPRLRIVASDLQAEAVRCARDNLAGQRAETIETVIGDLFDPLPPGCRGRIDVLTANVPYVPTEAIATMPSEARDHEPRAALDGGPDGLDVARRVIGEAGDWLAPNGRLLIETTTAQVPVISAFAASCGLIGSPSYDEDREITVMIFARAASAGREPATRLAAITEL